ncbi:MAG: CHAT domain-containing protein [Chloroflexota bacterium]
MNPVNQTTELRATALQWLRQIMETVGIAEPMPDFGLESTDQEMCLLLAEAIQKRSSDPFQSALLADEVHQRSEKGNWHDLGALAEVVQLLFAIDWNIAISHIVTDEPAVDTLAHRLSYMLYKVPVRGEFAGMIELVPFMVMGGRPRLYPQSPLPEFEWNTGERATTTLEALVTCASLLGLKTIVERAVDQLLQTLTDLAISACKTANSSAVLDFRSQYYRVWRTWTPQVVDVHTPVDHRPMLEKVGATLDGMHSIRMIHNTLVLENMNSDGRLRNLAGAVSRNSNFNDLVNHQLDQIVGSDSSSQNQAMLDQKISEVMPEAVIPDDIEWFAGDLTVLRYQLTSDEWQVFSQSYLKGGKNPYAREVIDHVNRSITDKELAQEAQRFPAQISPTPHFGIYAIDFLLRQTEAVSVIMGQQLEQANQETALLRRLDAYLAILFNADSVNRKIFFKARDTMMRLVEDSFRQEKYSELEQWCSATLPKLSALHYPLAKFVVEGYLALSQAYLATDYSSAALYIHKAASLFLDANHPYWEALGIDILYDAIEQADHPQDSVQLASLYLETILIQIYVKNHFDHVKEAQSIADKLRSSIDEDGRFFSACAALIDAAQTSDVNRRQEYLDAARQAAAGQAHFVELCLALGVDLSIEDADRDADVISLSPKVRQYMKEKRWLQAADQLRVELDELENCEPGSLKCRSQAASLSGLLHQCVDFAPHQGRAIAEQVRALSEEYGASILQDAETALPGEASRFARNANNLGWSAISLSHLLVEGQQNLLNFGTRLLEQAVRLEPADRTPEGFSSAANNLSVAYQSLSKYDASNSLDYLHKAEQLIREVIAVDERLLQSPDLHQQQIGRTMYIDYNNLGNISFALAHATYQSQWINVKSPESAQWYRKALEAYQQSAELAFTEAAVEMAADARVKAAEIYLELCNHYTQERYWSGGDVTHAFYEWLCEFSGGPVKSVDFLRYCGDAALGHFIAAATIAYNRNPGLLIDCLDRLVRMWSLSRWRQGIPEEIGRRALAVLTEIVDDLNATDLLNSFSEILPSMISLQSYWHALLQVEAVRAGVGDLSLLQQAYQTFKTLSETGSGVVRALARPYQAAFEFAQEDDGVQVTGLFVRPDGDRIEFRIPAQRRSVWLGGLNLQSHRPSLHRVEELRQRAAYVLAHWQPILNWDDLPVDVLIDAGEGKIGDDKFILQTTRLPINGWDAWFILIGMEHAPQEKITLSLPFIGLYDMETGHLDTTFPARVTTGFQVLIFGDQGITLEVQPYLDSRELALKDVEWARLDHQRETPELSLQAQELMCMLKTSSRIASADVGFIVRQDNSLGAACCAASYSLVAPSIAFPVTALHSFAPLYFFEDSLAPSAAEMLNQVNPHEIILVGCTPDLNTTLTLLESLFDPRRELLWIVSEDEATRAISAVSEFKKRIYALPGARYLLRAATSSSALYDPTEHIQIFIVPRSYVPATAQIALDLAALRRYDAENVPDIVDGAITYLNIKGNPLASRLEQTLFENPVEWTVLVERYRVVLKPNPLGNPIITSESFDQRLPSIALPQLPRRPLFFIEDQPLAGVMVVPYARQLGALLLPFDEVSLVLLQQIDPPAVYIPAHLRGRLPAGHWEIHEYPDNPHDFALHYQAYSHQQYTEILSGLGDSHPHLLAGKQLLAEMQPSQYVILSQAQESEVAWNYLAANYAAAMFAPIYLLDANIQEKASTLERGLRFLSGPPSSARIADDTIRNLYHREVTELPDQLHSLLGGALDGLAKMDCKYLSFISSMPAFPIELIGSPPLGTRFAIGRLAGPDLLSTSLLVTRAALSEEQTRSPNISFLLAESYDAIKEKILPGARLEGEQLEQLLQDQPDVKVELINTSDDLTRFLRQISAANVIHFTGHGLYDEQHPDNSGLVFREGIFRPQALGAHLVGLPLVFSNACETGLLDNSGTSAARQTWVGLAATFIEQGAVNYLGSLWPIHDESSRRFAEIFYQYLLDGQTVGESIRAARQDAFTRHDVIWASFALFGCPRSRLRPPRHV